MSQKDDFISALNELPAGIKAFLTTEIPIAGTPLEMPADSDEAIIRQGEFATALFNLIFHTFGGLTPIELLLRIGQKNEVLQGILLSGLEYVQKETHDFEVIAPVADLSIPCYTDTGRIKSNSPVRFSVQGFRTQEGKQVFDNRFTACTVSISGYSQSFMLDLATKGVYGDFASDVTLDFVDTRAILRRGLRGPPPVQEPLPIVFTFIPFWNDTSFVKTKSVNATCTFE